MGGISVLLRAVENETGTWHQSPVPLIDFGERDVDKWTLRQVAERWERAPTCCSGAKQRIWYTGHMTAKALKDVLQRVETWPEEAQEELAAIAREMDAQLAGGVYHATAEELEALDEAERSGVASEAEAAFETFRFA